jgi:hypothetical protein
MSDRNVRATGASSFKPLPKTYAGLRRLLIILYFKFKDSQFTKVLRWRKQKVSYHSTHTFSIVGRYSARSRPIDPELVSRIRTAYAIAAGNFRGVGDSYWTVLTERCRDIHECLLAGNDAEAGKVLENAYATNLFRGYYSWSMDNDVGATSLPGRYFNRMLIKQISGLFIRLAEAVGATCLDNPEARGVFRELGRNFEDLESVMAALDSKMGFRIEFPNPLGGEFGLSTERGVASLRVPHALFQAWRLKQWTNLIDGGKVLEIGAGMGRTGYYAHRFGIHDYTVVDLPLANVAQAIFLGQALGPDKIWLPGDPPGSEKKIRLVPPEHFAGMDEQFDVVLNADSLVEMEKQTALQYFNFAGRHAKVLISINQETYGFRVNELPDMCGMLSDCLRQPYWLREGYVEETYFFGRFLESFDRPH